MKKILVLIPLLVLILGLSEAFTGRYETLQTDEERKAEGWAKIRKNIGRSFYATPTPGDSITPLVFNEEPDYSARKFKLLEKEEFVIVDIFKKKVKDSFGTYKEQVWIKVKFLSGKIGYIEHSLSFTAFHLKENIKPKQKNIELDEALGRFTYRGGFWK